MTKTTRLLSDDESRLCDTYEQAWAKIKGLYHLATVIEAVAAEGRDDAKIPVTSIEGLFAFIGDQLGSVDCGMSDLHPLKVRELVGLPVNASTEGA